MAGIIDMRTATILQLFPLWKKHRNVDPLNLLPIDVKDASYERYRELQILIEGKRPTTAAEYAMKLVVCTDDFDSEYPEPLEQEVREIAEEAMTATPHSSAGLEEVIAAFLSALAAWYAARVDGDLPDTGPEPDAYNVTAEAFIRFQCATDAEVQRKLQFVASCQDMKEEVEGGRWFGDFSASLILPVVADPIIAAIAEFHAAIATFADATHDKSNEVCEAIAETTYSAPLDRLNHWADPVKSRDGAVAAIRFAREEVLTFDAPETVRSMVLAVAAYFDAVAALDGRASA